MIEIRGITSCVGYAALLEVTLPRNMRHFSECLVVTSPDDHATADGVARVAGARLHQTDAFTRHGAFFNKGLAFEESWDVLGRSGWILVHDADCLLPEELSLGQVRAGWLHGARRRILEDPSRWHPGLE